MSHGSHVILCSLLRLEFRRACLAWNGREPMALRVHVVVDAVLTGEGASACFAFEGWRPVIYGVHVLIASGACAERSIACFTLNPVTFIIHMVVAFILIPEFCGTGAAFEHVLEWECQIWGKLMKILTRSNLGTEWIWNNPKYPSCKAVL